MTDIELLTAILAGLEANNELLSQLLGQTQPASKIKTGFAPVPRARYIYANRGNGMLWYFWNGNTNQAEAVPAESIVGIVQKLEVEGKEYKGRESRKLNLTLATDDGEYTIQCGYETLFAQGLCLALSKIPVEALRKPIQIAPEAGTEEKVLFCRVFNPATGKQAFIEPPQIPDWGKIVETAIAKVKQAVEG